jgi:ABC-type multidrug transport system fused ATPase/permease subunit
MSDGYFEEEEFSTQFNNQTILRILALTRSYWYWIAGFLIAIMVTSGLDSYFTYLNKRMVDEGIVPGNRQALLDLATQYGLLVLVQSASVFAFIYLAGVLGVRPSSGAFNFLLQPDSGRLDHVASYLRLGAGC